VKPVITQWPPGFMLRCAAGGLQIDESVSRLPGYSIDLRHVVLSNPIEQRDFRLHFTSAPLNEPSGPKRHPMVAGTPSFR
jgi:hypothetical protein